MVTKGGEEDEDLKRLEDGNHRTTGQVETTGEEYDGD